MTISKHYSSKKYYGVEIEIREHGDWKFWDTWLRIFVWIMSISKSWKRRYYDYYSTTSVFTKTVYTYDMNKVSEKVLEHECCHVAQFNRDRLMPLKYIFSARKRIEYETEAYYENNILDQETITFLIRDFYMIPFWWSHDDVSKVVSATIKETRNALFE